MTPHFALAADAPYLLVIIAVAQTPHDNLAAGVSVATVQYPAKGSCDAAAAGIQVMNPKTVQLSVACVATP